MTLQLASETEHAWLALTLLLGGVAMQLLALWRAPVLVAYVGATAVCCAALLDRDPVLALGQILAFLAMKKPKNEQQEKP